jgi:hypothetical protein
VQYPMRPYFDVGVLRCYRDDMFNIILAQVYCLIC